MAKELTLEKRVEEANKELKDLLGRHKLKLIATPMIIEGRVVAMPQFADDVREEEVEKVETK